MSYAHLHTITNFTFQYGASHPGEYVRQAAELGYDAIAITDECSLAGIVKAFVVAEEINFKLLVGSRFTLSNGVRFIAIAPSKQAYAELSDFITLARMRAKKGKYIAHFDDLRFRLQHCLIIWIGLTNKAKQTADEIADLLKATFKQRLWIGVNHQLDGTECDQFIRWRTIGLNKHIPLVACGEALMHEKSRKNLQDAITAIREKMPITELGTRLQLNAEAYLKPVELLDKLYPIELLQESSVIADLCSFSMNELRYQYPRELVPGGVTPIDHVTNLVNEGKAVRWPSGVPESADAIIQKELALIEELHYEYYFLTVHDIVRFARSQKILCQGRGSAANSVVCYCLFITEIAPNQISVLFERFISRERDEPPDIDVDFESERREEVIQYIYAKYGRERAAITATVAYYRPKSAIRDIGKALGLELSLIDHLSKSLSYWDREIDLAKRCEALGLKVDSWILKEFYTLVHDIQEFPRHLGQHTGGFVISNEKLSHIVPLENATMENRSIVQWDKQDLEAMNLLKVDVLGLGMLTAVRKTLDYVNQYDPSIKSLQDIPREDPDTYDMMCRADTVGVFQIESRAQMTMLPRLRPRNFYDLIIEIALVRPGPIQGDMVHPYLRRRVGKEEIKYPSDAVRGVLERTLGVPIFQEQVMQLSMVAAGFTGGEADALRRAITNWGKNSKLLDFKDKFIDGLLKNEYSKLYAERLFEQVKGFGGYGFPESHSASFALISYASSWLKCHHPAAFLCGLLNSQPLGFYAPAQLINDARRHRIPILPVDINKSESDNILEWVKDSKENLCWGVRLGFREINGFDNEKMHLISQWRGDKPFTSIQDLARRSDLTAVDLKCLASADVFAQISGNRHEAHWEASAVEPKSVLLEPATSGIQQSLFTQAPTIEKDVLDDFRSLGHSLRPHVMSLLRREKPFKKCIPKSHLHRLKSSGFVRVAGLVISKQRPGTAKGTMFMTVEDETGDINVVIWASLQENFRKTIMTAKLVVITGTIEITTEDSQVPVIHVIAGNIEDYSHRLNELEFKSRSFR